LVDQVLSEAEAAGATMLKTGEQTFWGGYVGYFQDPEGFVWEVAWNPGFPLATDGSVILP
ncbi:MAG: VOC family protein, partial [Chloroflexi bacterium]|nr:VOC family protein [Chloroflexota bacterium]